MGKKKRKDKDQKEPTWEPTWEDAFVIYPTGMTPDGDTVMRVSRLPADVRYADFPLPQVGGFGMLRMEVVPVDLFLPSGLVTVGIAGPDGFEDILGLPTLGEMYQSLRMGASLDE